MKTTLFFFWRLPLAALALACRAAAWACVGDNVLLALGWAALAVLLFYVPALVVLPALWQYAAAVQWTSVLACLAGCFGVCVAIDAVRDHGSRGLRPLASPAGAGTGRAGG